MSWEPGWNGRGDGKESHGPDDEEEGEIAVGPSPRRMNEGPLPPPPPSLPPSLPPAGRLSSNDYSATQPHPMDSRSLGNEYSQSDPRSDFRPRFPGRGGRGGRHRHHGSFSSGLSREGSFSGRGGFSGGRGGPPPHFRNNDAPPFREEPPPFRGEPPPRDFSRPPPPFRSDRGRPGSGPGGPSPFAREGSFGGGPPAPSSFGRSNDVPPRDLKREGSSARDVTGGSGPPGSFGGPRDVPQPRDFGPREFDGSFGGPPRDLGPQPDREPSLGGRPRGDMLPRDPPLRGPGGPFTRSIPLPNRDNIAAFHRDPPRESSFSDLAGPPPRSFREERRVGSQGPTGFSSSGAVPPPDPRRPTDPRRRSNQDFGVMSSTGSTGGPPDADNLASPQASRRISSYSSLADTSTVPPNLVPSQPPPGLPGLHDHVYRSPGPRRNIMEPRSERDNFLSGQPPARDTFGVHPSQRRSSWSPAPERRPSGMVTPRQPLGKSSGYNDSKLASNSSTLPLAPPLSRSGPPPASFRDTRSESPRPPPDAAPTVSGFVRNRPPEDADNFNRPRNTPFQRSPRSSPNNTKKVFSPSKLERGVSEPVLPVMPTPTQRQNQQQQERQHQMPQRQEPPKPNVPSPLRTSALGDDVTVKRAETAVTHLREVVGSIEMEPKEGGNSKLPGKQDIMDAVKEIDKKIKEAQDELEKVQGEKRAALAEEKQAEETERKRLVEEEENRLLAEATRMQEEKKLEQKLKRDRLKQLLSEKQEEFDTARKQFEIECTQKVQKAKEDEMRQRGLGLVEDISNAEVGFEKDITKARNSVEKSKTNATKMETKLAAAQSQYESLLKTTKKEAHSRRTSSKSGKRLGPSIPSLVERIMAENNQKSEEAHLLSFAMTSSSIESIDETSEIPDTGGPKDPRFGKTCEEWSVLTKQVEGISDALYSEPSEAPYFKHNERIHTLFAPTAKEYVRSRKKRLVEKWTVLAEEYEVRKRLYEKQQRKLARKARTGPSSVSRKSIMAGDKESSSDNVSQGIDRSNILESGSRSSNNPYRRARRGNEVRSEYEQEQIIAEIAAKEAMEKRIAHGGCKLPHQVTGLERGMTASYINTFNAYKIDDPLKESQDSQMINVWTDMEKCIFLDRFLQFPKDFRRISSFLRNKTTKDCISFYYDSKQTVPYKAALKEHIMRRKRKGDYAIWDSTIQAAISVGAKVSAGQSEDKPVEFSLPPSDKTFRTCLLHPLRQDVLDQLPIDEEVAKEYNGEAWPHESGVKTKKRIRDPLFCLEKRQTKFLRQSSQESMSAMPRPSSMSTLPEEEQSTPALSIEAAEPQDLATTSTPVRKPPQKWTTAEKRIFAETLDKHGRDWAKLAEAIGTKNEKQIKNFYYDWKKGKSRPASEKKSCKKEKPTKPDKPRKTSEVAPDKHEEAYVEKADAVDKDVEQSKCSDTAEEQAAALAQLRAQAEALLSQQGATTHHNNLSGSGTPDSNEYAGSSHELIQQLLNQQLQQPQQPHSAIQQLLNQQRVQREQHQQQQQLNQLSLDEARRLLSQHQSQPTPVLSNIIGSQWIGNSSLLQGQSGLSSQAITSALRGDGNPRGAGVSDMVELQRLLQMQRAPQGHGMHNQPSNLASLLLGGGSNGVGELGASSPNNLSILQELANRGNGSGVGSDGSDHLSSLANAHNLLGFGAAGSGNGGLANFYRQTGGGNNSASLSDAFSLLSRNMQGGDGNTHGFQMPERHDPSRRY